MFTFQTGARKGRSTEGANRPRDGNNRRITRFAPRNDGGRLQCVIALFEIFFSFFFPSIFSVFPDSTPIRKKFFRHEIKEVK